MNLALKTFIEEKGQELVEKNLYRNFVLHCCNLFEFGVLSPPSVFKAMMRMQQFILEKMQKDPSFRFEDWENQRQLWLKQHGSKTQNGARKDFSGIFKQDSDQKKDVKKH